jgi:hypothetical protein
MSRKILTRMGLAGVKENENKAFAGIFPRDRLERWRRQRAVWSGQRSKLDQEVALFPVIAQSNWLPCL